MVSLRRCPSKDAVTNRCRFKFSKFLPTLCLHGNLNTMTKWYKIADSISSIPFGPNGLTEFEVNGKRICVSLHNSQVFACAAKCPHASGILAEGSLDAMGNIVCPLHRYKFSLQNGRNVSGEGFYLKTYPVETRDDGIYVGIPKTNLFF